MHIPELHRFVMFAIEDLTGNKILDVGCGFGFWEGFVRSIIPQVDLSIVGIELTKEQLFFCKKYRCYNHLVLADARYLPFIDNSFDGALATELIEHIIKSDGKMIIEGMERVSKQKIVISTPNGFIPVKRQKNAWEHKSGWYPSEFK